MRLARFAALLVLGLALGRTVAADEAPAGVPEIGAWPATYDEIVRYCSALAQTVSSRVVASTYGTTADGRALPLLTISAPQNLALLEEIQAKLTKLAAVPDERTARQLIDGLPAVVWMGYGIHGDETSASDGALEVARRLAGADDAGVRDILDKLIIYIDPVFNADGRSRTLAQIQTFSRRMPVLDTQDTLIQGQWPPGRGNHYFFDLNRDALYTVQPEARARVAAIVKRHPQFLADVHEMGIDETHLFAVPAAPFNPNVPAEVHRTWRDFAEKHAAAFDERGLSYYTRSWNEVFYPGYFDILLAYHGGTPMIYEQAANGGVTVKLASGRERTYRQSIDNQVRSSMVDLQTAAFRREDLLLRWWSARRAMAAPAKSSRTWIIAPGDPQKLRRLVQVLRTQGVQIERLTNSLPETQLHSIWGPTARPLPPGTLRVRSAQPAGAVVRNLFDFHTPMSEEFLARERRSLETRGASFLFDITAWDVAHAFDAEVYWVAKTPAGSWERLSEEAEVLPQPAPVSDARYGYLFKDPSLTVTARLLARGMKIRVATEPFTHDGVQYGLGDLLIRNDDQSESPASILRSEQAASGTRFVPVESARILIGPDLGDHTFRLLKNPRIALLTGAGTTAPSVGEVWHLLDVEAGVPVTLLDIGRLADLDLSRYDVIVVPDGDAGRLGELLSGDRWVAIETWARAGGTVVALRGAAFALGSSGKLAIKPRKSVLEQYPPVVFGRGARASGSEDFARTVGVSAEPAFTSSGVEGQWTRPVIGEPARAFIPADARTFNIRADGAPLRDWLKGLPDSKALLSGAGALLRRFLPQGAYLRVDLNSDHWLAYGASNRIPALFREGDALIADGGADAVGSYGVPVNLALSGLVWPEPVGYLASTAFLVREPIGSGQVVSFANNPLFRGYSLGTQRLFMNAVFLGPSFRGP